MDYKCEICGKEFDSYYALNGHKVFHSDKKKCRDDITEEKLIKLYFEEELSQQEIAERLDTTQPFISRKMNKYGIPTRTVKEQFEVYGHPMEGYEWSDEQKEQMKKSMSDLSGENNPRYGKSWNKGLTKETNSSLARQAKKISGKNNPNYGGISEEHARKALRSRRPTNLEKAFIELIEKKNLLFRYVGNGKLWIGNPPMNPDFVHLEKNLVLEILGDYWHDEDEFQERKERFARYGWRCIGIWEHEFEKSREETINILNRRLDN